MFFLANHAAGVPTVITHPGIQSRYIVIEIFDKLCRAPGLQQMSGEEGLRKQVEEWTKRSREAEEEKRVLEEENKEMGREREGVRGREDMMRGSGAGGLAGKAMGSAMHVELQARMVAAEVEKKKVRRRAETVGITAPGTAGRAERLNIQGVSGDHGDNLYFNSGRFGYSNRTPPKIPNDPGKVISWLRRIQLFLGSEGLEHAIISNPTCPVYVISCRDRDFLVSIHGEKLVADHHKAWGYFLEATCNTEIEQNLVACICVPEVWKIIQWWSLSTIIVMVVVYIFFSRVVIGRMAATSPAGVLDSSSCGPAGGLDSSNSSSMTVGIDISPSSLYTSNAFVHLYDNIISRICHAASSVVPTIGRNAFVHRRNIYTSAEDQSLGLEDRGTAGKMPRTTRKNRRTQRTHRWALYTNVRDTEGTDIWPAPVAGHGDMRVTAQLVESTVISVASALRHAGPSPCSRMSAWSLRLATAVARRRRSGAPFPRK